MNLARQDDNGKPKFRTELGRQVLAEMNDGRRPTAAEVERRAVPSSTPEPFWPAGVSRGSPLHGMATVGATRSVNS